MTTTPVRIRLNSPNGVVQAVPYLLGFEPSDSIVCVAIQGERSRLAFTVRLDYPKDAKQAAFITKELARRMVLAEADTALVVIYSEQPSVELAFEVSAALRAENIRCRDFLRVHDGRWWSFLCDNPECCPPEGTEIVVTDDTVALAAAHAMVAGRRPLKSREEVIDSVGPQDVLPITAYDVEPTTADEVQRMLLPASDGQRLLNRDAAIVLRSLLSTKVRDAVLIALASDDHIGEALVALVDLARRASGEYLAPSAATAAVTAYMTGDGLLCRALAERALENGPDELANLALVTLDNQLNPEKIREIIKNGVDRDQF